MPAELFRSVAARRPSAGHRLSAVPLSVAFHAVLLAVVVVVPLVATDALPVVPTRLVMGAATMPVVPVPPSPPPRRTMRPAFAPPTGPIVPTTAPSGFVPEIAHEPATIVLKNDEPIVGVPGGGIDVFMPAPPPPPEPPKPPRPVRMSEVRPPVRVHYEPPVYPQTAIMAHVEGTVTIEAIISTTGTVDDARVLVSAPLLDEAALAAVRQWVYRPTLLNGVPVPVIMTVKVEFKLR